MTVTRRQFCQAVGAAGISLTTFPVFGAAETSQPLRVIAYNIYAAKGWPHERARAKEAVQQQQMATRLALELSLYQPDIINFSESPREEVTLQIAELLGMHHVRFPSGGNWPGTILSRFPITASENVPLGFERPKSLFTRHWGRAQLQLTDNSALIVHSAHLFPGADPAIRLQEVRAMLTSMKEDLATGGSLLLIGDLNHRPETEEYELWKQAGWVDTFAAVGQGEGLTIKADKPQYRIDYIFAAGPIASQVVEAKPLFEGAFRLNTEDPQAFALSDHLPQYARFEL